MWSHFNFPFNTDYWVKIIFQFYPSVYVIIFGLAQSYHIKQLLLYLNLVNLISLDLYFMFNLNFSVLHIFDLNFQPYSFGICYFCEMVSIVACLYLQSTFQRRKSEKISCCFRSILTKIVSLVNTKELASFEFQK